MNKRIILGALLGLGVAGGVVAQTSITVPTVTSLKASDLVQVIPGGMPTARSVYATAPQVSGQAGYSNGGVATTAWSYTFTAGQQYYFIKPAGTLATGTLTTEANPSDGQRECFFSTQTQTALTWTANTGQTLDSSVPSAGVANTLQCIIYSAATTTWYRVQ